MTVKFTGLTILGSFTGQLLSGHRCWCTLDVKHLFIQSSYWPSSLYCRSQFTYVVGRRPPQIWRTSVDEYSFLTKLLTVTVCRQSIRISTTRASFYSSKLQNYYQNFCTSVLWTGSKFDSLSTVFWLAGDVDTQRQIVVRRSFTNY